MSYAGLEPIIDKILTELAANLPAELATRVAGPPVLALPAPAATEYTYGDRQIHVTYPAIEVYPVDTEVEKDNNQSMTGHNDVGIAIFVRHVDPGSLKRLIDRYAHAVLQVLSNRRAAGAFTFGIDWNGEHFEWGPTLSGPAILETDVRFVVSCTKDEQRA